MSAKVGVLGEALIDFIEQSNGHHYLACLGGGPFNFALAMAKQQHQSRFLTPLSYDHFGEKLAAKFDELGVEYPLRSCLPTSLAMVNLDHGGNASYTFYRQGIADRDYDNDSLINALSEDTQIVHTGGLALCHEDLDRLESILIELRRRHIMISIDANARPQSQPDLSLYYKSIKRLLVYADIIKLSEEDIAHIFNSSHYSEIAKELIEQGALLVALTFGAEGAQLVTAKQHISCDGYECDEVIDTIGSGDIFIASLIAYLMYQEKILSAEMIQNLNERQLHAAVHYACAAASINVGRAGCQPPTAQEIRMKLTASDSLAMFDAP